jgi:hypothetical protein
MAGIAWTQAEVDALRAAVASGVLTVVYDGPPRRQVTYQSLQQMRELLSSMVQSVDQVTTGRPGFILANTRKGH